MMLLKFCCLLVQQWAPNNNPLLRLALLASIPNRIFCDRCGHAEYKKVTCCLDPHCLRTIRIIKVSFFISSADEVSEKTVYIAIYYTDMCLLSGSPAWDAVQLSLEP